MKNKTEVISLEGYTIEGYSGDYIFEMIKESNKFYEEKILQEWLPYIENCKIILDIGANIGNHTLFWSKYLSCNRIISFESVPSNYECLLKNISKNNIKNVLLANVIVGEENEDDIFTNETISKKHVMHTKIDTFCKQFSIASFDFAKITVRKGTEGYVLNGMKNVIESNLPDLWIKLSDDLIEPIMNRLFQLQYVLADIKGCNFLFLHPSRHRNLTEVNLNKVICNLLYSAEQAENNYYNYILVNKKLSETENQLKKTKNNLHEKVKELNDYKTHSKKLDNQINYIIEQFNQTDTSQKKVIEDYNKRFENIHKRMEICLKDYNSSIEKTKELYEENKQLKSDNKYLTSRINIIKKYKLGRLAIKIYNKYQNI